MRKKTNARKSRVKKTRNGGKWTEAYYWGSVRAFLRRSFRYWEPAKLVKLAARRHNQSNNKRLKWEYLCASCEGWFPDKDIQVDHIIPVGSLRCGADLEGFLARLTPEEGFQVLCKPCHQIVTNTERSARKDHPREESSYRNMQSRCNNSNSTGYARYGGRGIKVCDEWSDDFYRFFEDMGPRPEGTSLDRIDYDGDYYKDNCRWATQKVQCNNKSDNVYLTVGKVVLTISEWADKLGIKPNTLVYRLLRGWSTEEALEIVPRDKPAYNGRLTEGEVADLVTSIDRGMTQTEWGKRNGMDSSQVSRLYRKFKTNEERNRAKLS